MVVRILINYFIDFINYILPYEIPKYLGPIPKCDLNGDAQPLVAPNKLIKESVEKLFKDV